MSVDPHSAWSARTCLVIDERKCRHIDLNDDEVDNWQRYPRVTELQELTKDWSSPLRLPRVHYEIRPCKETMLHHDWPKGFASCDLTEPFILRHSPRRRFDMITFSSGKSGETNSEYSSNSTKDESDYFGPENAHMLNTLADGGLELIIECDKVEAPWERLCREVEAAGESGTGVNSRDASCKTKQPPQGCLSKVAEAAWTVLTSTV